MKRLALCLLIGWTVMGGVAQAAPHCVGWKVRADRYANHVRAALKADTKGVGHSVRMGHPRYHGCTDHQAEGGRIAFHYSIHDSDFGTIGLDVYAVSHDGRPHFFETGYWVTLDYSVD